VGQGTETQINLRKINVLCLYEGRQIEVPQVWKHLRDGLPRLGIGAQRHDRHGRMAGDEPDQLGAGVTGRPENSD
jgi:hypothetical protein